MIEDRLRPSIGQAYLTRTLCRSVLEETEARGRCRPRGSFLICGTFDLNAIARDVAGSIFADPDACLLYDLTDYSERYQLLDLVGMNGGIARAYYDGILTAPIADRPASLVVFQNIDRAHPDFQIILRQILEQGKSMDYLRGSVGFEESVILATVPDPESIENLAPDLLCRFDKVIVG